MLVTVKRGEDGKPDSVSLYPESQEEVRALDLILNDHVNLSRATIFVNKEPQLRGKIKHLPGYESPDANAEVYRHL